MLPIQLTGKNIEITDVLRDYVEKKFAKLERHFDKISSLHIILKVSKLRQIAEAEMHIPGKELYAKEETEDMYKSIDKLTDVLAQQIEKHKGKHKERGQI